MKLEARWDNAGRDQLTISEMVEMGKDGYEVCYQRRPYCICSN